MRKLRSFIFHILAFAASAYITAHAGIPEGYYDSLEGLCGVDLKKAVKRVAANHIAINYGDDTWEVFKTSDVRYINGTLCYWDMYSDNNVPVTDGKPNSTTMNIEHGVANSWWNKTKNDAYKDLYHLNPSNSDANSRKGNYPLSEISSVTWNNGVTYIGTPKSGMGGGSSRVYEPCDAYKGDFARAFFYMFTIYDDINWQSDTDWMYDKSSDLLLKPWAYEMLLKWSVKDPVSQKEIDRNEAIYKVQRNRNPFIDCPELAQHIWGSKKNTPFHYDGSYEPGGEDPEDPDTPDNPVDPDPGTEPVPSGYWYAVMSSNDINTEDMYVIVSVEESIVLSTNVKTTNSMAGCRQLADVDDSESIPRLTRIPSDAMVVKLENVSSGYAMHVYDVDGTSLGYLRSPKAKELAVASVSFNDAANVVSITPSSSATKISYINNGAGDLKYNKSAEMFRTYTSGQNPVMMYRLEAEKNEENGVGTAVMDSQMETKAIYDINGRLVSITDSELLQPGLYIVVTNKGVKKILK